MIKASVAAAHDLATLIAELIQVSVELSSDVRSHGHAKLHWRDTLLARKAVFHG